MVGLGEPRQVRAGVVDGSLLRRDGAAAGARPPAQRRRRRAERGGRGGADAPLLDDRRSTATRRSSARRSASARASAIDRRRARAVGAVSGRNRADRQRRHQPASPVGDDGDRPRASDDGAVRPAGAGRRRSSRRAPSCARCTARIVKEHPEAYPAKADFRINAVRLRDQITRARADRAARPARGVGAGVRHRLSRTSRT